MIITKLTDGLGNQMFQYALGKYLAKLNNTELKLDIRYYNNIPKNHTPRKYELHYFNITENFATQKEIDLFTKEPSKGLQRLFFKIKSKANTKTFFEKIQFKIAKSRLNYHTIYENNRFKLDELKKNRKNLYISGFWQSEHYFKEIEQIIRMEFERVEQKKFSYEYRVHRSINKDDKFHCILVGIFL